MAQAKIDIRIGTIHFTGEGDEKWLSAQLDKLLERAGELASLSSSGNGDENGADVGDSSAPTSSTAKIPLGTFLKGVGSSQTKRFLATAVWLAGRGNKKPTTRDISKALSDNHQPKLTNPSQSLNDNVKQGYCEKDGRNFYVTPEGFDSLPKK